MTTMLLALGFAQVGQPAMPDEFKTILSYVGWIFIGLGFVFGLIKVIAGIAAFERGEESKKLFIAAALYAAAPWLVIGAFRVTGLWERLELGFLS